jgi:hypothetical protein
MLRELTICAALATALEIVCIGAFVFALLVVSTIPWL